jgi:hypothetical protein
MFNSLKAFAVAAGLVGAVLASDVHARGFGGGGGGSRIRSSNFSASQGNGNYKQLPNLQKPVQLNSVKPAITPSKLGNSQATDKLVNLGKGNQFSKGKNTSPNKSVANKGPNFKNQKYSKDFKSYWGYWPWDRRRDWGFYDYDGWNYCYDDSCGDYYIPEDRSGCCTSSEFADAATPDGDTSGQGDSSGNE